MQLCERSVLKGFLFEGESVECEHGIGFLDLSDVIML